jgi:hypothetical protein
MTYYATDARTFASSAPTPALTFIAKEFNISVEVANLMSKLQINCPIN